MLTIVKYIPCQKMFRKQTLTLVVLHYHTNTEKYSASATCYSSVISKVLVVFFSNTCGFELEVIMSNKGGMKLSFGGFMYTKQVSKANNIRRRYVKRTLHCKGSLKTTLLTTDPELNWTEPLTRQSDIHQRKKINKVSVLSAGLRWIMHGLR